MALLTELVASGLWTATQAAPLAGDNNIVLTSTATTQAAGTPITTGNVTITSATTTANAAFVLPNDAGYVSIFNGSGVSVNIFPAVGFNINNLAVNAGFGLASGKSALFFTAGSPTVPYGNWAVIVSA